MHHMQPLINSWSYNFGHRSLGLLLIRIGVGLVFLMHGWGKVGNMEMVQGMFVGFGLPAATGIFIAWLEVIGGVAMIIGILPRVFGLLFGIQMLAAIFLTGGFATGYKPHELEILLMLLSIGIMLTGS